MSLVELEAAVEQLPEPEFAAFVAWMTERNEKKEAPPSVEATATEKPRRPFGLAAGEFVVPGDFDAPLPEEILRDFEGR